MKRNTFAVWDRKLKNGWLLRAINRWAFSVPEREGVWCFRWPNLQVVGGSANQKPEAWIAHLYHRDNTWSGNAPISPGFRHHPCGWVLLPKYRMGDGLYRWMDIPGHSHPRSRKATSTASPPSGGTTLSSPLM